jgi:transposase
MIVIGADPHKKTHTLVAVDAASGEQRSCETVATSTVGSERALRWARRLGAERVWAIEDCRHVSGRLEAALITAGERVVRVAPRLMAGAREGGRGRGKSDPIDALAVARAAVREGIDRLPAAQLEGETLQLRLLLDHREDLVAQRSDEQRRLRWHLHALGLGDDIPAGALDRKVWLERIARRLTRAPRDARVRIARELVRSIAAKTRRARELEREIAAIAAQQAPQLLAQPGCGALTAAKLIGEIAGAERFSSDAKLARAAGVAPIPASSGRRDRHRLDRGGNRQLNCALHRWAVTAGRIDPVTAAYLSRKQAEGKTRMDALRCLKRHLARRTWQLLTHTTPDPASTVDTALALT